MKSIFLLFFSILFFQSQLHAEGFQFVRGVNDGDTIILQNNLTVRYIGINAPEIAHENKLAEPFGEEAKAFNRKLVMSKFIRIEQDIETTDQYNRQLAYVFLKDGLFANREIIRNGLAYVTYKPPNIKYDGLFLKTQQEAMTAGKGLWSGWKESSGIFIGNTNSRRFHATGCASGQKISRKNQIRFSRKWDAFWEGYSPCKKCIAGY